MTLRGPIAALALLGLGAPGRVSGVQPSHLLVVAGIGGDAYHRAAFHDRAARLVDAARDRFGMPAERVIYLDERPARDPERIDGRSTRAEVSAAVERLVGDTRPGDVIFIVLIGHGSGTGTDARFNLPGPDLTAADFAAMLAPLSNRHVVFVNTATASGDFLPVLSGANRTIITATKTGFERNESVFGEYFVRAYATDVADVDKDGRLSVLEAFAYAVREVARSYEADGRLLTEHAQLDDDGDGKGTGAPGREQGDGRVAARLFLADARVGGSEAASADTVLARLYANKATLEHRLDSLRRQRATMTPEVYEDALEALLVDLALTNRAIRARERETGGAGGGDR